MKVCAFWKWVLLAFFVLVSAEIQAQPSNQFLSGHKGASPQIVEPIDEEKLASVPAGPVTLFRSAHDQGAVAPDMTLERMQLVLKRSTDQESALEGLIRSQQDMHSPLYHQWLSPEEFGSQFGPAQEDIDKITTWLQSKGMRVTNIAKGRSSIEFSATHSQIQNAFHTELHWFETRAGRQYANVSSPRIPAALSSVVAGVGSLNSYVSRPLSHVVRQLSGGNGILSRPPSYLSGSSNYLAPGDFWTIYNATPAEAGGITGKGVTIGIAGRSDVAASDVAAFRSAYLGNSYSGTFQQLNTGSDPGMPTLFGDDVENALDVEWATALAPDAKVVLVSSMNNGQDGMFLSAQYLIDNNLADIVSVSYGECESFLWTGGIIQIADLWEQAAAQGITVLVAAGDNGSAGCDIDVYPAAEYGLQVNGLASSPYNVAVGGTEFDDQENSWAGSMSSTPLPGTSAQAYIPEEIWNESQTFSTLYAGSGGVSNCYFSLLDGYDTAGCGGGWPKPDWQTGVIGIPADGARDLPDVSFAAGLHDAYLITLRGSTYAVGGTSAATPAFAGVMALVNQKAGGRQGMANYRLYGLAGQEFGGPGGEKLANLQSCNASLAQDAANSCVFYDVTRGTNSVPCHGGTQNCSASSSDSTGMLTGYDAGAGYDLGSGLGSINITNLVNTWSESPQGTAPTTARLQISPAWGIVHGSPVTASITVAPASGSGSPSGSVSLTVNGAAIATAQLSNGSWSGPIATLPGGDYQVTAQYSGDGSYAQSISPQVHVDVNPEPSTTTVSVTARDAQMGNPLVLSAIPYGSNVILNAMVKGKSGIGSPVNAVSFTVGGDQFIGLMDPAGRSAYAVTTLPPGGYSATAAYMGDASFAQSTSAVAAQFTVVQASTAVVLSSGTATSGMTPVTAEVSAATFGNAPTGAVAFFVNGTLAGNATVQPDLTRPQHWAETTFNVSTAMLNQGSNAITAQYMGDANYARSPVSAPVSIFPNKLTVTAPNPPLSPSRAPELKTGAQVSISAIIFGSFQNIQVDWAPGINPASGWSGSGIAMNVNLSQPVLNAPIATWDTSSIGVAGYYTLRVSVTDAGTTTEATTYVYLEPDLLSSNWPLWLPDTIFFNVAPVPVTDFSGKTDLLLGTFGPGAQLFNASIDGSAHTSIPLNLGSWWEPAAANLHFGAGDDLIYPDKNSVVVVRPDGTKDTLAPPASMSNLEFNFQYAQVLVDDVDGDSIPEVVTIGLGPGPTPWTTTAYLFAWRNNGQQLNSNFPVAIPDLNPDITAFAAPRVLVGDIDGDGKKEFVVLEGTSGTSYTPRLFAADGMAKPWNAATIEQPYALQMALADLDHNGKLETILESSPYGNPPGYLHVLNPDGAERPGWPQPLPYFGSGDSIAVGDLNRDGNEEIVMSHGGALSVYKSDGTSFWPNWTNPYGGFGPALLADVNGDGYPEIVAPFSYVSQDPAFPIYNASQLLVLDRTGATIRSWKLAGVNQEEIELSSASAGDFLNDGKSEIALGFFLCGAGSDCDTDMGATVLSTGWSYDTSASDWPMLHQSAKQSAVLRRVRPTAITLSSSANPSNDGWPILTIAVVSSAGGSGTPAGTVNLIDGDRNIGSCMLSSGSCSITPALSVGAHSLIAGYVGDQNYDVSYSAVLTQTIGLVPTSTTLTISPSGGSLSAGANFTLTATVTSSSGTPVPTGSVVFAIGEATETIALNVSGVAAYTGTAPISGGQLSLSAAYQGSAEFSGSTSNTLTENIVANAVPTISSMSPAYVAAGGATFTMTVNGTGFNSGSTVYWGKTALATYFVNSSQLTAQVVAADIASAGAAPVMVQTAAPGGGTSNVLQFEVDSASSGPATAPSFSTAAATVSAGTTANYPVSLPSSASAVSVTCLNLPAGASCSYLASSGAVSMLTSASTPIGVYQVTVVFTESLPGSATAAFLTPFLLLPMVYLRRKLSVRELRITTCAALLLLAGAALATGCGGASGGSLQPIQPTHQISSSGVVSLTVK